MSQILRKYYEIARIGYRNNSAQFGDITGIGFYIGLTLPMVIWVLALSQAFFVSHRTRMFIKRISEDVKTGNIAYSLNKPYSFPLFSLATNFGVFFSSFFFILVIGSLVAFLIAGSIKVTFFGIAAGFVLALFGALLNNVISMIIAFFAFWTEETSAFRWWYDKIHWIFGGVFIPISLFPEQLQKIAEFLPFSHLFYTPAAMIVNFDFNKFVYFLSIQLGWILVFILFLSFEYRLGVKKISVSGG